VKEKKSAFHGTGWMVVLVTLVAILLLFQLGLRDASPGGLSSPHAAHAELEGQAGCIRCHGTLDEDMASACGSCHGEVLANLEAGDLFHGRLPDGKGRECKLCHLEHNGGGFALLSDTSFLLAGLEDRATYDHGGEGFVLADHRAGLDCVECHANADQKHLEAGQKRFIETDATCTACHEDEHEGSLGQDCASCHGQSQAFLEVAAFEHENFEALGAHRGLACSECHQSEGDFELSKWFDKSQSFDQRSCASCHDSPHSPSFLAGVAVAAGVADSASCTECHGAEDSSFTGDWTSMSRDLHAQSGVELLGAHAAVACADCHSGATFEERFPGRTAQACAVCHEDPHVGPFQSTLAADASTACSLCHDQTSFLPSNFTVEDHAKASFALDESHGAVACGECHLSRGEGNPPVLIGTESACVACHEDPHAGVIESQDCADCHQPTLFADLLSDHFEHGTATGFELLGEHASRDCEACHQRSLEPDGMGRTFGRVADLFGEPATQCATCHQDVHRGAFDGSDVPSQRLGRGGCARCHTEDGFSAIGNDDFDHGLWTQHPLLGAHQELDCQACHRARPIPDEDGRSFGFVAELFGEGSGCARCHADPHLGLFDNAGAPVIAAGQAGCARCHTEDAFRIPERDQFDHARWTGFVLDGDHAALDCITCHDGAGPEPLADAALGRARGRTCIECHGDPHVGQFIQDGSTDCARCHQPGGGLAFDHNRDARFALDENHVKLDCATCHVPWPLASGNTAIRYKPLGTLCADCHGTDYGGGI